MIETLTAFLLAFGLRWEIGHAAYYADDVMEKVVAIRQAGWTAGPLPMPIPDGIIGFIAVSDCDRIGERAWIFWAMDGTFEGPFLISDCCCSICGDCDRMRRKNIVLEVGFNTAKRKQILGYGPEYNHVVLILKDGN